MESSKITSYRGFGAVQNYGILVLVALFALNAAALGAINWFEINNIRHELATLSEKLPDPNTSKSEQIVVLPEDIFSFYTATIDRTGFYETRVSGKDFLAYTNPSKNYILMKSEESIRHEVSNFALTLGALYVAEVVLLLGWWYFLRTKVRELFEIT